jgi:hypothetical protein
MTRSFFDSCSVPSHHSSHRVVGCFAHTATRSPKCFEMVFMFFPNDPPKPHRSLSPASVSSKDMMAPATRVGSIFFSSECSLRGEAIGQSNVLPVKR